MITQIEDRNKIKKVYFKYPDLFKENASSKIIELYDDILMIDDLLTKTRDEVRRLENELNVKKSTFDSLKTVVNIEYELKNIECVDKENTNLSINNPTDASNKNYTG